MTMVEEDRNGVALAIGEPWTVLLEGRPVCFAVATSADRAVEIGRGFVRLAREGRGSWPRLAASVEADELAARQPTAAELALFQAKMAEHGGFGRFVSGVAIAPDELQG